MSTMPDEELICAYFDGELSGADLARAEQLLATRADCRQLLEELTALRANLQALPHATLGNNFVDGVLRRAEREMLQVPAAAPRAATAAAPASYDADHPPLLSWRRWQRPLAWSALAAAASLLIMMFSPERKQEVALAPVPRDGELAARKAAPTALAARSGREDRGAAGVALDTDHPQPMSAPAAAVPAFSAAPDDKQPGQQTAQTEVDLATGEDALLVVECEIADLTGAEAALQNLFASNQIQLQGQRAKGANAASPLADSAEPGVTVRSVGEERKDKQQAADYAAVAPSSEAFFITTDTTQMRSALGELAGNRVFNNVTLERVSVPREELAAYDQLSQENAGLAVAEPMPQQQRAAAGRAAPTEANEKDRGVDSQAASKPDAPSLKGEKAIAGAASAAGGAMRRDEQLRAGQNTRGAVMQLPLAEVQTRFHLQNVPRQQSIGAARGQQNLRGSQQQLPVLEQQLDDHRASADQVEPTEPSRALIILHVVPPQAGAAAAPAASEPESSENQP